jgi:acetyl esterase/lipase
MNDSSSPSKQSEAVRRHWETAWLSMTQPGFEGPDDESWGNLTAEPRGVDYLETEAGVRALLVSYQLLPAGVFPVPADDVTNAYRWLLDQGISPGHVAFAGDSVGGWLSIIVQLRARERRLPLPAAALLLSPSIDMETAGESYETNRETDPFFKPDVVRGIIRGFLGEGISLVDPRVNPLYADLGGLSPLYIQAGGDETLADDARLLDEHARKCGVETRLRIYPGMLHTFQMAAGRAPEAGDAIGGLAEWVRPRLGLPAQGGLR